MEGEGEVRLERRDGVISRRDEPRRRRLLWKLLLLPGGEEEGEISSTKSKPIRLIPYLGWSLGLGFGQSRGFERESLRCSSLCDRLERHPGQIIRSLFSPPQIPLKLNSQNSPAAAVQAAAAKTWWSSYSSNKHGASSTPSRLSSLS